MSEPEQLNQDENEGPPARNLRKNSGRNFTTDPKMAGASDNMSNQSKKKNRETKKQTGRKRSKTDPSAKSTKGIRQWLKTKNKRDKEETEEWKTYDWNDREKQPIEEWSANDEGNYDQLVIDHVQGRKVWKDSDTEYTDDDEDEDDYVTDEDGETYDSALSESSQIKENKRLSDNQQKQATALKAAVQRIEKCENTIELLTGIVMRQDETIRILKDKVIKVEIKIMKANILVAGIQEMKGENCIKVAQNFFKKDLKIESDIKVATAFRIGKGEKGSLLIKLLYESDKGVVYKHIKNIKETQMYVNDHLPEEAAEEQRRKKLKVKYNKGLIDAQQQDIEWKRGNLVVDGREYKPKVREPLDTDILKMSKNALEMKKVLAYKIYEGETETKNGNVFTGYAARVYSIDSVITCYKQLRYRFPSASHIMCSFRMLDPDMVHMQDAVDHGEIGAGRRLLQMLIEKSYDNKAVFVVRCHSGVNIGPARFEIINRVAESAVAKIPEGLEQMLQRDGVIAETPRQNFSLYRKNDKDAGDKHSRRGSVAEKVTSFNELSTPKYATWNPSQEVKAPRSARPNIRGGTRR